MFLSEVYVAKNVYPLCSLYIHFFNNTCWVEFFDFYEVQFVKYIMYGYFISCLEIPPQILHECSPLFPPRCLIVIKYVGSSQVIFQNLWPNLCTYVCTCMCVCVWACVPVCDCVSMHTRVCAFVWVCVCDLFISICGKDTHSYRLALVTLWKSNWPCMHLSLKMLFCLSGLLCVCFSCVSSS